MPSHSAIKRKPLSIAVGVERSCRRKFIRSRPARFFETIGSRGPDWVVNRFDRKQT
jgi:hypothetical protein